MTQPLSRISPFIPSTKIERTTHISFIPVREDYRMDAFTSGAENTYVLPSARYLADTTEDAFIRENYNITSKKTNAYLLRDYEAKMARLESMRHEYVDIDIPIEDDDEGDW